MAFRAKKCCCCSLTNGVCTYGVLYAFGAVIMLMRIATAGQDLPSQQFGVAIGVYGIHLLRASLLLIGIAKVFRLDYLFLPRIKSFTMKSDANNVLNKNSTFIFVFLVIEGVILVVGTIFIIIMIIEEPLFAVVLVFIAIQAFILFFVYSYYKELKEVAHNSNTEVDMSNIV